MTRWIPCSWVWVWPRRLWRWRRPPPSPRSRTGRRTSTRAPSTCGPTPPPSARATPRMSQPQREPFKKYHISLLLKVPSQFFVSWQRNRRLLLEKKGGGRMTTIRRHKLSSFLLSSCPLPRFFSLVNRKYQARPPQERGKWGGARNNKEPERRYKNCECPKSINKHSC